MSPAPKFSPQEQEELILNAAANCIQNSSLLDFTMSAVAKAAGLSMGSVYKHVQSKEDIIIALCMRVYSHQSEVFKQIFALPLTTPEKIVGITMLSMQKIQIYPFENELRGLANNQAILKRASGLWIERMMRCGKDCEAIFVEATRSAASSGELHITGDEDQVIEEFNLGCWALHVGFEEVHTVTQLDEISKGTDNLTQGVAVDSTMNRCITRFINSFNWQTPLTIKGIKKVDERLRELGYR